MSHQTIVTDTVAFVPRLLWACLEVVLPLAYHVKWLGKGVVCAAEKQ